MIKSKLSPSLVFITLLTLSLLIRLWLIWQGQFDGHPFDGLYGQDPYSYYGFAQGLRAQLDGSLAPLPEFRWPPGYPYLIVLTSYIIGMGPPAGQLISLLASLLTPILTTLITWETWGKPRHNHWIPILAGLLVAYNPQLWQSSIVIMADTPGLALATLGIYALIRYAHHPPTTSHQPLIWLLIATATTAYAILTRWGFALTAIPVTIYALHHLKQRRAPGHALLATATALLVLAPLLQPLWQLLFIPTVIDPAYVVDLQVYRWNPLNALRNSFTTADGLLQYRLPNGLYYLLAPAHRYYLTPLLAPLLPLGLLHASRQPPTASRQPPAATHYLLIGWLLIITLFHAGTPWQNFRFTLAYLPPVAIYTALGFHTLITYLKQPSSILRPLSSVLRPSSFFLLASALTLLTHGGLTLTNDFIERKNDHLALVQWVESQTEPNAQLITFNLTLTFQTYSNLDTQELFYLTPEDVPQLTNNNTPTYLLVDIENVTTQWANKNPGRVYTTLQTQATLTPLGQQNTFTLFQISR